MGKAYDPAYKIEVCKQVESGTATVAEISRETGISENTLYTWFQTQSMRLFPKCANSFVLCIKSAIALNLYHTRAEKRFVLT